MTLVRLLLAVALAAFASCRGPAASGPSEPDLVLSASAERAPSPDPACLWAAEGVLDVLAGFRQPDDDAARARTEAALDRHHVAHLWGGWIDGASPIPITAAPICDARGLTLVAEAALAVDDERLEFEALKIAAALRRNGLSAEAELLERRKSPEWEGAWHRRQLERAEEAARQGLWAEAYYHASNYNPRTGCGNCAHGSRLRRDRAVVSYLERLERWEDLRAICRAGLASAWYGTPCFVEPLVESYHREGRPDLIASELADLRAIYGVFEDAQIDAALAHREILAQPDDLAILRLDELLQVNREHEDRVREILAHAGPAGVRRWAEHLAARGPDWNAQDQLLALTLADTGDAELGETLQRWHTAAPAGSHKDFLARLIDRWRVAAGSTLELGDR